MSSTRAILEDYPEEVASEYNQGLRRKFSEVGEYSLEKSCRKQEGPQGRHVTALLWLWVGNRQHLSCFRLGPLVLTTEQLYLLYSAFLVSRDSRPLRLR